jgi:hypothetical protein
MMLAAIDELSTVRPHERPHRKYTLEEWRVYCEGYDWALVMAYKVLELAYQRWKLNNRTRRAVAKAEREKAGVA